DGVEARHVLGQQPELGLRDAPDAPHRLAPLPLALAPLDPPRGRGVPVPPVERDVMRRRVGLSDHAGKSSRRAARPEAAAQSPPGASATVPSQSAGIWKGRFSTMRMWFPNGSRIAKSMPYGRSSGSSRTSTPFAFRASHVARASSVVNPTAKPEAPFDTTSRI